MKFFPPLTLLSLFTLAAADRTFNITSALAKGQFEKYSCLTTERWILNVAPCLRQCTVEANKKDGCAYNDFACHCVNYQKYSDLIEPCAFPPEIGGRGPGCTLGELGIAQPIVNDMCNFFNATLYAGYAKCPRGLKLSPLVTLGIAYKEETV